MSIRTCRSSRARSIRQGSSNALPAASNSWTYDLLGRRITVETQDVDASNTKIWRVDTTMYDEAGNPRYQRSRRNLRTSFVFDELNRMTSRSADACSAPTQLIGMADPARQVDARSAENLPYPYYPTNTTTGSYDIPSDNASFIFDPVTGLMTDANNAYAQVHRDYYANGMLKTETLKLAQWSGAGGSSPSFTHTYVTSYAYDKNGRRTSLTYPTAIAPSTSQNVVRYNYDPSGELQSVTDLLNRQFTFAYNWRGERTELKMPGAILDSLMRDDEGLLTRQSVRTSAGYGMGTGDVRDECFTD